MKYKQCPYCFTHVQEDRWPHHDCGEKRQEEQEQLVQTTLMETLAARDVNYGDFTDNADVAQRLKDVLQSGKAWNKTTPVEREAMHQICSKLSRLVTGNPHHADTWTDIGGYAHITSERLPQ